MSITSSSFPILITPGNNILPDKQYQAITYSSSAPRRYGTYTPTCNVFIFPALSENFVNGFQSNTATGLAPDTQYYITAATQNGSSDLYGPPADSRSNIDSNLRYKRTLLPDGPSYINNASIINSSPNIFLYPGIPANCNTNGFIVYNIYNISANNLFIIDSALGVHTSNNTGSTLPILMSNIIQVNGINDIVATVGGFTQASNTITVSGSNIQLNISNISDKYNLSNYTGFYRIFNTSFSLIGDCSPNPINIRYIQQASNFIRSNTLLPFYRDNLSTTPIISCDLNNFTSIINPEPIYVTGVPSYNSNFRLDNIQITSLYKNFIAPGPVIYFELYTTTLNYEIKNQLTMNANNLIIYDTDNNPINISTDYPLPSNIKLSNINLTLDNRLYTLNLITEPRFTLAAINLIGETQFVNELNRICNFSSNSIYWDLPSISVVNNTSVTSDIQLNSGYGLRVLAGYNSTLSGQAKNEYNTGYNENGYYPYGGLINFNKSTFSNSVNFTENSNYYYELPLFGGYFQTSNFKMGDLDVETYINYQYYENSYLTTNRYTYPDYSSLSIDPNMYFRYICFKYRVKPKTIFNRGLCMIQFINNNFTMDTNTYIIGEHLNDIYYNNYIINYKIITFDGLLETSWLSLQAFTPDNFNFSKHYLYDGALTNQPFISDDTTEYILSASNRIFVIPANIENVGFDIYIRVGIPKDDAAGFQYISTCFNRV